MPSGKSNDRIVIDINKNLTLSVLRASAVNHYDFISSGIKAGGNTPSGWAYTPKNADYFRQTPHKGVDKPRPYNIDLV